MCSRGFLHQTQKSCWTCHTVTWQLLFKYCSLIGWWSEWTWTLVKNSKWLYVKQVRSLRTQCQKKKEKKDRGQENTTKVGKQVEEKGTEKDIKDKEEKDLQKEKREVERWDNLAAPPYLRYIPHASSTFSLSWRTLVCSGDYGGSGLSWKVHSAGPTVDRKGEILLCSSHVKEVISVWT